MNNNNSTPNNPYSALLASSSSSSSSQSQSQSNSVNESRFEGTFSGQDYIVIVRTSRTNETLNIHLESKYEPIWWTGSFTASYLEDLTQRTGVRRTFAEFIDALLQGFSKRSESSNVDILTFADLEVLRSSSTPSYSTTNTPNAKTTMNNNNNNHSQLSNNNNASKKSAATNNKRYLIVTSETPQTGDRVHYPLSLNMEDLDNVDLLRTQIRKMKQEMEEMKEKSISGDAASSKGSFTSRLRAATGENPTSQQGGGFFLTDQLAMNQNSYTTSSLNSLNATSQSVMEQLKSENDQLKTKIKRIEETASQKRGAVELDNIVRTKFDLEEELESTKRESFFQLERLRQTLSQKESDLNRNRSQLLTLQQDLQQLDSDDFEATASRFRAVVSRVTEQTEEEVLKQRKTIEAQSKELDRYLNEAESVKQVDRRMKNRIKQLELELDTAVKRVSTRATTDRLYSSPMNRNISPSLRNSPTGSIGSGSANNSANRRSTSVPSRAGFTSLRNLQSQQQQSTSTQQVGNSRSNSRNLPSGTSPVTRSATGISPSYNRKPQLPSRTATATTTTTTTASQNMNVNRSRSPIVGGFNNRNSSNSNSATRRAPATVTTSATAFNRRNSPTTTTTGQSQTKPNTVTSQSTTALRGNSSRSPVGNHANNSNRGGYQPQFQNKNRFGNSPVNATNRVGGNAVRSGVGSTTTTATSGSNYSNNRVSPQNRYTNNATQNSRVSPSSRNNQGKPMYGMQSQNRIGQSGNNTMNKQQYSGGYRSAQQISPRAGARNSNAESTSHYLQAKDQNLIQRIDEARSGENSQPGKSDELDSRLNKLSNLLQQARQ